MKKYKVIYWLDKEMLKRSLKANIKVMRIIFIRKKVKKNFI